MTMSYKVSLIGNKYGKLTVTDFVPRVGKNNSYWECKCECGNEETLITSKAHLITGHTQSCGCIKRKHTPGSKFGKLTIIKDTGKKTKDQHRILLCKCECGNITETGTDCLNSLTISCGCNKQSAGEKTIENILIENNIIFKKEYSFDELTSCNGDWLVRFDFAVFDEDGNLKYVIEYDGIQHFKPIGIFGGEPRFKQQQLNDSLKNQFCKERGIPLIRVPYTESNISLETLLPY